MHPGTLQTFCQILFAFGIIVTAFAGFGSHHYAKKSEQQKEKELNSQIVELVAGKNELVSQNKELLVKIDEYQTNLAEKDQKIKELERKAKMTARGIISTYDFKGNKREKTAGSIKGTMGLKKEVFEQMIKLQKSKDFPNLLKVCEQQIKETPEWFTPYLFRAVAYSNMGKKAEAIADLRFVIENTPGDPEYVQAEKLLLQLEETP